MDDKSPDVLYRGGVIQRSATVMFNVAFNIVLYMHVTVACKCFHT